MSTDVQKLEPPLKPWEQIEIIVGENNNVGKYKARIEDFPDGFLQISDPILVDGVTLLRNNTDIKVNIVRKDAIYQFTSNITKEKRKGEVVTKITFPNSFYRVQRRQFFRLEINEKLEYAKIPPQKDFTLKKSPLKWRESQIVNISGGGILIELGEEIQPEEMFLLKINIFKDIELPEIVAGICRWKCSKDEKVFAGFEFIMKDRLHLFLIEKVINRLPKAIQDFDNYAQSKLTYHIFEMQRDFHKKGLL
ncbi:MAG: hypothetical protein GY855_13970 [candidate division Zixibacteria bacterium]|nr:hypothetical protein [candidate division Zixibacteria bacterium]